MYAYKYDHASLLGTFHPMGHIYLPKNRASRDSKG